MTHTPVEPLQWQADGSPFSPRFGDVYRSRSGALAQARQVFAGGCDLPQAWHKRSCFAVLETGFGLGLNFLTTWALWRSDPERCERLRFISVEAHPADAPALLRSAGLLRPATPSAPAGVPIPDTADTDLALCIERLAPALAQAWSRRQLGWQRWHFEDDRVELCLGVGDAHTLLSALPAQAVDAIYLDGFSPAKNPAMWSPALLSAVARHAVVGTRLASYTASSAVRRDLTALGFDVAKVPGLPPKRESLRAHMTARGRGPMGLD